MSNPYTVHLASHAELSQKHPTPILQHCCQRMTAQLPWPVSLRWEGRKSPSYTVAYTVVYCTRTCPAQYTILGIRPEFKSAGSLRQLVLQLGFQPGQYSSGSSRFIPQRRLTRPRSWARLHSGGSFWDTAGKGLIQHLFQKEESFNSNFTLKIHYAFLSKQMKIS